ncbi:hypothetical protein [Streptomyces marianii]|uniref:hypothetical protein n=1 Tax=Streptomyces marianii TaxID=1817406 RepID=UPI0014868A97|nr:hypothetical protein [Streptomyces marianii]
MADARTRHHAWVREHGVDMPEVAEWTWDARARADPSGGGARLAEPRGGAQRG